MSSALNQMQFIGNLGRDPELRYTPQGKAVCDFSAPVTVKKGGEDLTFWFKVTVWDKQAENCKQYLQKGDPVFVQGELSVEDWTDRGGNPRYTLCVNAFKVGFLPKKNREEAQDVVSQMQDYAGAAPVYAPSAQVPMPTANVMSAFTDPDDDDDDVPFSPEQYIPQQS